MQWTPDNICVQLATSVAKFLKIYLKNIEGIFMNVS